MNSLKNRLEFMQDYFDKEKGFLIKHYISKKTKKTKSLVKKLNLVDNEVRNRILKIYMEKCLSEYCIKLNKWRVKVHGKEKGMS